MSGEDQNRSVTQWIADLKAGHSDGARRLAERYWARLEVLARAKFGTSPRRVTDEEDVVVSVFESLCRGATEGRFADLSNRDDLWWFLIAITKQKTIDHVRRQASQKRGGDRVFLQTAPADSDGQFGLDQLVGDEPTPEFLVSLEEEHQRLLALLRNDTLREVATLRMEGYSIREIADRLGIGTRAVDRKLAVIRTNWERELAR